MQFDIVQKLHLFFSFDSVFLVCLQCRKLYHERKKTIMDRNFLWILCIFSSNLAYIHHYVIGCITTVMFDSEYTRMCVYVLYVRFIFGYWIKDHTYTQYTHICACADIAQKSIYVYPFTHLPIYNMICIRDAVNDSIHYVRSEQWAKPTFLLQYTLYNSTFLYIHT